MSDRAKRIAVLQRICASYRVDLFLALGQVENVDFKLFIGRDSQGISTTSSNIALYLVLVE